MVHYSLRTHRSNTNSYLVNTAQTRRQSIVNVTRKTSPQYGWVQRPHGVGERRGKRHPRKIRQKHQGRHFLKRPKRDDGAHDKPPQQHNFSKGPSPLVPYKKQPSPQRVNPQLNHEEPKRESRDSPTLHAPDQPRCNAHQKVKHRPNRPKQPSRWRPCRTQQLQVKRARLN